MLEALRKALSLPDTIPDASRRLTIAALPLGALGIASTEALSRGAADPLPAAATGLADDFIEFSDRREKFKALFRLERDLRDEGTTLTTYQFMTYAVVYGSRPQPIVRWQGMEFSYFRRIRDLTWRIHAHNLSYPMHLTTGEFVSSAVNPFTGATLDIRPMKLLDDPGVLHGPQGYLPLDSKTTDWLDTFHVIRREGDLIKSEHIRPTPDGWPAMFIESSCSTVNRRDFLDTTITALPFQSAGFYVFPFPSWMQMGERPGHMIGSWSGRRAVNGVSDLPLRFRERVQRENPELLSPRWGELERSLSPVIAEALES